jgi:hypothetical protein
VKTKGLQTLDQQTLDQQTLGTDVPAASANGWIVVIMPPPPSLPDPMVITGSLCSAAARLVTAYSYKIGGYRTLRSPLSTQGHDKVGTARDRTQLTRTHPLMSFR